MFRKGERVVALELGLFGSIVKENDDGTFTVKMDNGTQVDVDEFELVPMEDDDGFLIEEEDDTLWEDLAPYRNMNQGYL
jgi:preprotein translocase subunit YajC